MVPAKREALKGEPASFVAKVSLTNDKTGRVFEPEEVVTTDDFPLDVLEHWEQTGRVVRNG